MPYYPPSAGGSGNAPTNPKPYIYLPYGWDAGWKVAKAAQAGTVAVYGASQAQGTQQNSNIITTRWPRLILNWLNGTVGGSKVAETFTYTDNTNKAGTWSAGGSAPWAVGGVASGDSADGFVQFLQTNGSGTAMTLTTPFACTDIDFFFRDLVADSNAASFYKVDAAANVPFATTGDGTVKRVQITGLSNATHTVQINCHVANQFGLMGATCYYGARGATGWTLAHHSMNGLSIATLAGVAGVATAWKSSRATLGPIAAPDLLIIQCGGNEDNAGVNNVAPGLTWVIEAAKVANPSMSVLLLAEPVFATALSDVGAAFGAGYGPNYYRTIQQIQGVAAANGYGFINQHARWSPTPVASGFINSGSGTGQPHPNDVGHQDFATAIESVL